MYIIITHSYHNDKYGIYRCETEEEQYTLCRELNCDEGHEYVAFYFDLSIGRDKFNFMSLVDILGLQIGDSYEI